MGVILLWVCVFPRTGIPKSNPCILVAQQAQQQLQLTRRKTSDRLRRPRANTPARKAPYASAAGPQRHVAGTSQSQAADVDS